MFLILWQFRLERVPTTTNLLSITLLALGWSYKTISVDFYVFVPVVSRFLVSYKGFLRCFPSLGFSIPKLVYISIKEG
jgi:hypothetical protein